MLRFAWLLASALVVAGAARSPEPEIHAAGGQVTIHARNLPLSQVLDRLSSVTGMDVTYDGARPTTPVTVSVAGVSEAAAIVQLMEGLGVSYAFRSDAAGERVVRLIVSGAGTGRVVGPSEPARIGAKPGPASIRHDEPVAEYHPLEPAVHEGVDAPALDSSNQASYPPGHPVLKGEVPATQSLAPDIPLATDIPDLPPEPVFPPAASYPRN